MVKVVAPIVMRAVIVAVPSPVATCMMIMASAELVAMLAIAVMLVMPVVAIMVMVVPAAAWPAFAPS